MAQLTGSITTYNTDYTSPVGGNISVPSDAQLAVVVISGLGPNGANQANWGANGTVTLGGVAFTDVTAASTDHQTAALQTYIGYIVNPATGTQTFDFQWAGGNPEYGPVVYVLFLTGVNTSNPIKDSDRNTSAAATFTISSLDSTTGDYSLFSFINWNAYGTATGGSQLAQNNHIEGYATLRGGDGITSFSVTAGGNYGTAGAIVIRNADSAPSITDAGDESYYPGESITITGTGFGASQGAGSVRISPTNNVADGGAVTQTVTSWSNTSITITTARGSLAYKTNHYLFVTSNASQSNASGHVVQFYDPPVITDAGDENFYNGETGITITGTSFKTQGGSSRVWISPTNNVADAGRVEQTVTAWTDTSITITAVRSSLSLSTNLYLFVVDTNGDSNTTGTVVQFSSPPNVTISDAGDELYFNGESITITGTNFGASQGAGRVWISPTNNVNDGSRVEQTVTAWSDTSITITTVKGGLSYLTNAYLFVVNNLSQTNSTGHVVQLEPRVYIRDTLYDLSGATLNSLSGITAMIWRSEPAGAPDQILTGLTSNGSGAIDWEIQRGAMAINAPIWLVIFQPGGSPYRMTARRFVPVYE